MILGLKSGVVELADHDPEWKILAARTIERLWLIFGSAAKDIQHVGSTAIAHIKAKLVIDIAVAAFNFDDVMALTPVLEKQGFICVGWESNGKIQPMYQCGEFVSGEKLPRILTHFIHIVIANSQQWHDYINHRDYFNSCYIAAQEYESIKLRLAEENNNNYHNYFLGKQDYIQETVIIARLWNEFCRKFTKITPVNKGWSSDKKYYIETADSQRMLLRVSDIAEYDRKKAEYEMMERIYALGVNTSRSLEFGLCNDGKSVYSLSAWIDGKDAEKALPLMSETEQYIFGLKAGETLRKIHTHPAPDGLTDWENRYFAIINERIDAYRSEGSFFSGNEIILDYLDRNRGLLHGRPQCFLHGDYHEGNLMVSPDGELYAIDLLDEGFGNYGDPWYDFKTFGENDNAFFSTGFVRGYFNGDPPQEFWDVLTYYIVTAALTSIVWMKYHKPDELSDAISWNERNAKSIQAGKSPLMKWYLKDFHVQYIDGIPCKLQEPFDF